MNKREFYVIIYVLFLQYYFDQFRIHYFSILFFNSLLILIVIDLTMPAVSTLAPALRRISTISTFPLRDAHMSAVVPY